MTMVVGVLIASFGLALALVGPRVANTLSGRSSGRFEASNTLAFRLIGTALVVLGLLYATVGG
ncbi:hypothetical protein AB0A94_25285 [Streptomyces sp. NPDC044984]|uniref:hypothetical protein n=1 Tax=Streptomyces sp. NPDC044984 TaxID=3154335 RepID=UPI0033DF829D